MGFVKIQPVLVSYCYLVSSEKVFDAWLKPEIAQRWMFKSNSNEIVNVDNTFRWHVRRCLE